MIDDRLVPSPRGYPASHDEILRSTVRLARLSFAAAAASVFLLDRARDELVFEAASGRGEDRLLGVAISPDRGIAGWVAGTGETIIVRGAEADARFDREFAEQTGYIPSVILAAPLEDQGDVIGVLEVLDPDLDRITDMDAINLLTELSTQSGAALALLLRDRTHGNPPTGFEVELADLLAAIGRGEPSRASAVRDLVRTITALVDPDPQ